MRLHITGSFDIAIPSGVDEDEDDRWSAWRDAAIQAALADGRWLECTEVADTETGVLDEHGWVR